MNRYKLICNYCSFSWEINYQPQEILYCFKCKDTNIKLVDLIKDGIDYYSGSPPFEEAKKRR